MDKISRNVIFTLMFSLWIISVVLFYISDTLYLTIPFLFIMGFLLYITSRDMVQTKHSLLRNYPLIGRLRWVFESERSKIQQYFVEHDTNGTPYNREKRSDVYQKSKNELNTVAFGTQLDVYKDGYEYLKHSMYPIPIEKVNDLRVTIGGKTCKQPYSASLVNISAMSYGALSCAAIEALNRGAMHGYFFHNTGEGGISEFHLKGGDLCYQIGTGYFGCGDTINGKRVFNVVKLKHTINRGNIKMIEIKLSQGAKPSHGGILPAKKNTKEIAEIRGVEQGVDIMSLPYHSAFNNNDELLQFITKLKEYTYGLPIGIKMCVGDFNEVSELFKLMKEKQEYPDFITIDGSEGGTGASPLVFTNHIGTPLMDGLKFVNQELIKHGLRDEIKIIASGKASSSFDVIKLIANGADMVNMARTFMLSLGCIQARQCNSNTCPVGIATQNKYLIEGLDPNDKCQRVYNFHKNLTHEIKEVLAAMAISSTNELNESHILVRNKN